MLVEQLVSLNKLEEILHATYLRSEPNSYLHALICSRCITSHNKPAWTDYADTGCFGNMLNITVPIQAYYMDKQYRRAHNLLKTSGLADSDPRGCHLAAQCLAEIKDWEGCLNLLGGWDSDNVLQKYKKQVIHCVQ